ncbi:MAG: hypothetical protein V1735_00550 [Nanoarchaeota archaeon]
MPKKCIICGEAATLMVKDSSDYYCVGCADDCFADNSLLEAVREKKGDDEDEMQDLRELLPEQP